MVLSSINYIVKVMRERKSQWMKHTRHSRGLSLHIQWGDSFVVFQSTQLSLDQPTPHTSQAYEGGTTVTLILHMRQFQPRKVNSLLKVQYITNILSQCPVLTTHCCRPEQNIDAFSHSVFLPPREVALGWCLRSLATLRGPTLLWNSESEDECTGLESKSLPLEIKAPLTSQDEFCPWMTMLTFPHCDTTI